MTMLTAQRTRVTTRRTALGRAALAAALPALGAACGGPAPAGEAPAAGGTGPVTLDAFIGGLDNTMLERWDQEIGAPFTQRHPNVTLHVITQAAEIGGIKTGGTLGVVEKLVAMIAAGDPPDLNDLPRSATWQFEQGFLDDKVDGFVKRDKYDTRQFNQREFASRATHQGKVLQIPFKHGGNTVGFVVNRNLFAAEGVALPDPDPARTWTFDQFVEASNRLTKRAGGATTQFALQNYGWYLGSWPLLWEADWVSADGKTVTCDSAEMLDCYTKFNDLFHRHHVLPLPGEAAQLFGTANLFNAGKAALAIFAAGSWGTFITRGEIADLAIVPMPRVKRSSADVNVHSLGIIKGSRHPEPAWAAIRYLNEGARLARYSDRLPAILKEAESWATAELRKYPNADPKAVFRILETHVPQINLSGHKYQDDMLRILNPALDGMLAGKEAPVPLLRRLKPELQVWTSKV
jgi:ABC-type glycerol-3-phosphate transport system substrate-binding protein